MSCQRKVLVYLLLGACFMLSSEESSPELIPFSFEKKQLIMIIDDIAHRLQINIIPPQSAADLDTLRQQRVSYRSLTPLIPAKDALNLLMTFLELSGFSLIRKKEDTYTILRNRSVEGGATTRDTVPLYVDNAPLPQSDERITFIYFLRNLKVPTQMEKESHGLSKMLKDLVSPYGTFLFDPTSNAVIIKDKASHIETIKKILEEFERSGIKESVVYMPLRNVNATDVVTIFDSLKKASGAPNPQAPFTPSGPHDQSYTYFAQDTKVFADSQRNALIIMGGETNVNRISDFVADHIDLEQDKGTSILHTYALQHLDAQTFAPALSKIVSSFLSNGQAQQAPYRKGEEHIFRGVQILAEYPSAPPQKFTTEAVLFEQKGYPENAGIEGIPQLHGNRLIVAARQDDWRIIKQLIIKLDKPQYQVILEMLIVDFSYDDTSILAGSIRNLTNGALPCGVQFLASHITPVTNVLGTTPVQLAEDLLNVVGPNSVAVNVTPRSTLISFNDPKTPGIFGLLQILQTVLKSKITSYPYLVVTNNQKGSVESEQLFRASGELVITTNGTYTIPQVDVSATIKVVATPHIVSDDRLRLDIGFTVEYFVGTQLTRLTRGLKTTATLASNQILAMGGLLQRTAMRTLTRTPILGSIPIIGWFARGDREEDILSNIVLFVCPTIIEPKTRPELTARTRSKLCQTGEIEVPFCNARDPICKLFFRPPPSLVDDFCAETSNLNDFTLSSCIQKPLELLKAPAVPRSSKQFNVEELKELLALNDRPFWTETEC